MEDMNQETKQKTDETKQAFISQEDRPEVKLNLDTPLADLHLRDLGSILGFAASKNPNFDVGKSFLKEFFDKPFPEVAKDPLKELKSDKLDKIEKFEKNEKLEKSEKLEKDGKFEKAEMEPIFDPRLAVQDPRIDQLIQAVANLSKKLTQLANQLEELRKKPG